MRFWGKREGFFGGSGFRAKTDIPLWQENEGEIRGFSGQKWRLRRLCDKMTKMTVSFERKAKAIYYFIINNICNY